MAVRASSMICGPRRMERRVAGLIQDRPGPNRVGPFGLLQALADVVKMFMKEDVVPLYADRVLHTLAPLVLLVPALASFAVIPFGSKIPLFGREISLVVADVNIGILYVFALASVGVYGLVLAGWSSNNKFALMGGIRSSAQVISYELSMGLAAIATLMAAGSLRLTQVVEYQATGTFLGFLPTWNCFTQPLGCVIFIVAAFAETNRVPFDLPEAEAELVAGYHTEYSGFRFGAFFMAEYLNLVASSMMMATLYFGGWSLPLLHVSGVAGGLLSVAVFFAKTMFFVFFFMWVRWTLPRFRFDQLMDIGWKALLPLSLLNLLWTGTLVLLRGDLMPAFSGELVVFTIASVLALGFALAMVVQKTPVRSVLSLVVTFFGLAIFSIQLAAPFIAVLQVFVYAGAILVLFLFVIMLLNLSQEATEEETRPVQKWLGLVAALALGGLLSGAALRAPAPKGPAPALTPLADEIPAIGRLLFSDYPRLRGALLPAPRGRRGSAAPLEAEIRMTGAMPGVAPMAVPPGAYLVVGTLLFAIGLAGALLKRNALSIFLSIELMMNAVNLLFLTYARMRGDMAGQMIVFFVIAVAAAEASVGLALFVALFRAAARWTGRSRC